MNPIILLVTTARWYPTSRLAMALAKAGCTVEVVCPDNHPVAKTKAVQRTFTYRGLMPLKSITQAIAEVKPELVIPGDDLATHHLHDLHHDSRKRGNEQLCRLIECSLGAPDSFSTEYARAVFMETARSQGTRVPKTQVVASLDDLRRWIEEVGFPFVLKADGTTGGYGVRIVHTPKQAALAFRTLHAPASLARAAKRALIDKDLTLIWPALLRRRPVVNAQVFVNGREATSTIACSQGRIQAALHFEVVKKSSFAGHATVVRLVENAEMSAAAEKMVRTLNLSGLHGFDFMLEKQTGLAYLIEMNPRATQVGHLSLGAARDIPAALRSMVSGLPTQPAPKLTDHDTIALFPQEWIRDSESEFLQSAYHDVPWEEPELIRHCVRNRRQLLSWYSNQSSVEKKLAHRSSSTPASVSQTQAAGLD